MNTSLSFNRLWTLWSLLSVCTYVHAQTIARSLWKLTKAHHHILPLYTSNLKTIHRTLSLQVNGHLGPNFQSWSSLSHLFKTGLQPASHLYSILSYLLLRDSAKPLVIDGSPLPTPPFPVVRPDFFSMLTYAFAHLFPQLEWSCHLFATWSWAN